MVEFRSASSVIRRRKKQQRKKKEYVVKYKSADNICRSPNKNTGQLLVGRNELWSTQLQRPPHEPVATYPLTEVHKAKSTRPAVRIIQVTLMDREYHATFLITDIPKSPTTSSSHAG